MCSNLHRLVLVVDDDESCRELVAVTLARARTAFMYEVIEASDGGSGLELAIRRRPDLVISDVQMPVLDGEQLIRRLRARDLTGPVVLLSAAEELEAIARRVDAAWLRKPCDPERLMAVVEATTSTLARCSGTPWGCDPSRP